MVNLHRVLVPTDFGPAAAAAVAAAGAIAAAFDAELTVLHAETFEVPPYFTRGQMALLEQQRRDAASAAAEHLRTVTASLTPHPFSTLVIEGPPADVILGQAAEADLVVMGTHGLRGARRWWLGSVAERVLGETTVPLLVLHAADPTAPDVLFGRTQVLSGGPDEEGAVAWARTLASRFGGRVEEAVGAQCTPAHLDDATIVAVALPARESDARVGADVAALLRSCPRPMLFVPAHVLERVARGAERRPASRAGVPNV
jgi:nucleotide-binding universal stress UspA family protein